MLAFFHIVPIFLLEKQNRLIVLEFLGKTYIYIKEIKTNVF